MQKKETGEIIKSQTVENKDLIKRRVETARNTLTTVEAAISNINTSELPEYALYLDDKITENPRISSYRENLLTIAESSKTMKNKKAEIMNEYSSPNELFKDLSNGREPYGSIEVELNHPNIVFIFQDPRDYALAYFNFPDSEVFENKILPQLEQAEKLNKPVLTKGLLNEHPKLGYVIYINKTQTNSREDLKAVLSHERAHLLQLLVLGNPETESKIKLDLNIKNRDVTENTDKIKKISNDFDGLLSEKLVGISKEIMSFTVEGTDIEKLRPHIMQGGHYWNKYFQETEKVIFDYLKKNNFDDLAIAKIKEIWHKKIHEKYNEIVSNAIQAVKNLKASGFSDDNIQTLFLFGPSGEHIEIEDWLNFSYQFKNNNPSSLSETKK